MIYPGRICPPSSCCWGAALSLWMCIHQQMLITLLQLNTRHGSHHPVVEPRIKCHLWMSALLRLRQPHLLPTKTLTAQIPSNCSYIRHKYSSSISLQHPLEPIQSPWRQKQYVPAAVRHFTIIRCRNPTRQPAFKSKTVLPKHCSAEHGVPQSENKA